MLASFVSPGAVVPPGTSWVFQRLTEKSRPPRVRGMGDTDALSLILATGPPIECVDLAVSKPRIFWKRKEVDWKSLCWSYKGPGVMVPGGISCAEVSLSHLVPHPTPAPSLKALRPLLPFLKFFI